MASDQLVPLCLPIADELRWSIRPRPGRWEVAPAIATHQNPMAMSKKIPWRWHWKSIAIAIGNITKKKQNPEWSKNPASEIHPTGKPQNPKLLGGRTLPL